MIEKNWQVRQGLAKVLASLPLSLIKSGGIPNQSVFQAVNGHLHLDEDQM
jgi:hypothetical protein